MKRPVTSLCRRPGKKTAHGQSVPGAGTIFAHRDALRRAGRSAGQKPPGRGLKTAPARAGDCVQAAPMGEGRQWEVSGAGKHYTGRPPGQRAYPAQKQPPAKPEAVHRLRHGGTAGNGGVWWLKVTSLGARRGRGHAWAQKQPPAEARSCAQTAPTGERRAWGCLVPGSITLGARQDRGHTRRKNSPRRGPEAVWMRDMGVTCPGRSV